MIKRKRRRPVQFIEPTNIFEQLEERVVLDASIAFTGDQTVNEDQQLQWTDADVEAPSEGDAGFEYSLEIDVDGVGVGQDPVSLDDFNTNAGDVRGASGTPPLSEIAFNPATGELTWTPDNRDVGTYDFIINSDDGAGDTDQVVAQITVNNVQPIITTLAETTFTEDVSGQTFDVESTDEPYGVTYSLVDGPDPVTDWLEIDSGTGVISVTSGAPTDAHVGTWEFFVRVNDGTGGGNVDQAFILTVENSMDFDTADSDSVDEDDAFLFDVDTDTENEGIAVKYSLVDGPGSVPSWLSIDQYTGVITGNPDNSDVNPAGYIFAVLAERDDGVIETEQQTFTLYVNNTDPEFLNVERDIYFVERSGDQTFDVETSDEDVPSGLIGYTLVAFDDATFDPSAPVENPASIPGWLSVDGNTGIVTGDPANVDVGDHYVWVKFDDGNSGVIYERFEVHVGNIDLFFTSPDRASWVEDVSSQSFSVDTSEEGDGVTYSFDMSDPNVNWDGNPLTYRHPVLGTAWLIIDATDGTVSSLTTPDNNYVGDYTFDILADEGHGDPAIVQTFTLTVVNTPPVIVSADVTTV
ncbi:MAG: putative Ig domain-containing protein, partial [Pseudomonadota bacterium]